MFVVIARALGVITFQLLVGRPCFQATGEFILFEQILNHPSEDFVYPRVLTHDAKEFISAFLIQDATKRLGVGSEDSDNGYPALKVHSIEHSPLQKRRE